MGLIRTNDEKYLGMLKKLGVNRFEFFKTDLGGRG